MKRKKDKRRPITVYDKLDTSALIDESRPLRLADLGLVLPEQPPTSVVSLRLPSKLLNAIRAAGAERDISYQALIKLYLAEAIEREKRKKRVA